MKFELTNSDGKDWGLRVEGPCYANTIRIDLRVSPDRYESMELTAAHARVLGSVLKALAGHADLDKDRDSGELLMTDHSP